MDCRRNSDEEDRLRERAALASGNVEDRARTLVARMRRGVVTQQHLAVAGWLGKDQAAKLVVPAWKPPAEPRSGWAVDALRFGQIERPVMARAVAVMLTHVADEFEKVSSDDHQRLHVAVASVLAWSACPCEKHKRVVRRRLAVESGNFFGNQAVSQLLSIVTIRNEQDAAEAAATASESAASVRRDIRRISLELAWQRKTLVSVLCGDLVNAIGLKLLPGELSG